ncbi:MAG: M48 family metalloprotease [Rhodobacteraceae bacterium]|nr:M48 family metalloprotease [Paracoccaceae bacterium]
MSADLAFTRYAPPPPTSYHVALANWLERREPTLWRRFASAEARTEAADGLRLEILKSSYRLDPETHAGPYAMAQEIAEAMALTAPVLLYQAERGRLSLGGRNAALFFEPDAAHIVFSGDALTALDDAERRFVIGHELAHHLLWSLEDGRFWTSARLLDAASHAPGRADSWAETARLEKLYTEVYADRFGLWAIGDLDPALSGQLKLATGLNDVSAAAFLAQAEEALAGGAAKGEGGGAEGETHPETFIRAALLAEWAHDPTSAEARARALIQGSAPLQRLDILAQEHVAALTRWLLSEFITHPWTTREPIMSQARALSPDIAETLLAPRIDSEEGDIDALRSAVSSSHPTIKEYFAYLMLDFTAADHQLSDVMLAAALIFAEDFGLSNELKNVAAKELKTTKTKLAELERNAVAILARAELSLAARDDAPSLFQESQAIRGDVA